MLSVVKGIEPHDQLEAMLAAQMAVTHDAVMTFARRLKHVENIPQQDSTERAFNKLARTFAVQVETLKRYRSPARPSASERSIPNFGSTNARRWGGWPTIEAFISACWSYSVADCRSSGELARLVDGEPGPTVQLRKWR